MGRVQVSLLLAACAAWAGGCGALRPLNPLGDTGGGGTDTDTDGGTGPDTDTVDDTETGPPGAVSVATVDPPWGSNAGGSLVTITGGPFAADAVVLFGGVPSTHLAQVNTDSIVATVPTSATTGPVDVTVQSGGDSGTLPGAFEYWADGTGKYGAYGRLGWYVVRGDYWSPAAPPPYFYGYAYFAEPSGDKYWKTAYSDKLDGCNLNYSHDEVELSPPAPSMELTSGTASIVLTPSDYDPNVYEGDAKSVDGNDVLLGGVYALEPMPGGDWPQFTGASFATIPVNDPDVTVPAIDGATQPRTTEAAFDITWGTPYDGDYILIELLRSRDPTGATLLERVTCTAKDDGSFRVPTGTFTAWDATKGDFAYLYVGRAVESSGTLPFNNAKSGVVGVNWEVGVVYAK